MKHYPSITKEIRHDVHIWAFDKLDGSNIRAEWNSKKGFYKFGTKNQLMDEKTKPFGVACQLIRDKYESDIAMVFKEQKWRDIICFFELHGPSSAFGQHNFEEKLDVTLIDANPYKEGILEPAQFIKLFGHLDIPKVLYQGKVTTELFDKVKQSTLPGMTGEGVVCKGASDNGARMPVMFKIKSQAWLDKLRIYVNGNENLFNLLS